MALSRLNFETLIEGTNEVVVYALIPNRDLMAMGPQAIGTTLANHPLLDRQGCTAYDSYKLGSYEMMNGSDGEYVRANFLKSYTATDVQRTVYNRKQYGWPPVLSSIKLKGCYNGGNGDKECVGNSDTTTEYACEVPTDIPTVDVQWSKDSYDGITTFKTETFLSNTQHDLSTNLNGLAPRSIHFNRHVISASIPPSLHASTVIWKYHMLLYAPTPDQEIIFDAETFAATTQTSWADHVVSDEQDFFHGVWRRVKVTAITPSV